VAGVIETFKMSTENSRKVIQLNCDPLVAKYLDVVVSPLDYHDGGRVPDGYNLNTMKFVDFMDVSPFYLPPLASGSQVVTGVVIMLTLGQNTVSNNTVLATNPSSIANRMLYGWAFALVGPDGTIINATLSDEFGNVKVCRPVKELRSKKLLDKEKNIGSNDGTFFTYGSVNYNYITGATGNTGYNLDTALINSFRVLGAGFKLLPTNEVAINNTVNSIMKYRGCTTTPMNVKSTQDNSTDVVSMIRNSANYHEYCNGEGICGRLSPLQEGIYDLTEMLFLGNWNNTNYATDNMYFPLVHAQFVQPITMTTSAQVTPFNFQVRFEMEVVLTLPTPLRCNRTAYVEGWKDLLAQTQYNVKDYPVIGPGHTFPRVVSGIFGKKGAKEIENYLVNRKPLVKWDTWVNKKNEFKAAKQNLKREIRDKIAHYSVANVMQNVTTVDQAKQNYDKLTKQYQKVYNRIKNRNLKFKNRVKRAQNQPYISSGYRRPAFIAPNFKQRYFYRPRNRSARGYGRFYRGRTRYVYQRRFRSL